MSYSRNLLKGIILPKMLCVKSSYLYPLCLPIVCSFRFWETKNKYCLITCGDKIIMLSTSFKVIHYSIIPCRIGCEAIQ